MPFQFRLKVLLKSREYLRTQAQTALADAKRQLEVVEFDILRVEEDIRQQNIDWQERQSSGMNVTEFLAFSDYIESLERYLLKLNIELERARREVDKARTHLVEKEKEVKILESLKERQWEEFHLFQIKREQKQLDEAAIFRDHHKKDTH